MFENENTETTSEQFAPETSEPVGNEAPEQTGSDGGDPSSQVVDLDSVQKFRFAGREWTPKDFQGAYMMQSDYTRKTQQLAEERKYYDNLSADLESVRNDPRLADKFKSIYPKKFHNYLGFINSGTPPAQQTQQPGGQPEQSKPNVDPEFLERFNRVETAYKTQAQQAADAQVEANCQKFGEKYSSVKGLYESLALNLLSTRLDNLKRSDPDAVLSDKDWDAAYKQVHENNLKVSKDLYSKQVKQQKETNQRAGDVAQGGGIPGQAPKNPRTIREATRLAMTELESS